MFLYGKTCGFLPFANIWLFYCSPSPLLPLGTLIYLNLCIDCTNCILILQSTYKSQIRICSFLLFFCGISLTFCCHLCFLCSVFTTHFHLPTWRISLAGDIYIVSNLNVSVCAYYTETGSSIRTMGKCMSLYGLANTMFAHRTCSLLNSPRTHFCHSLRSHLPIKPELLFHSSEQTWNADEGLERDEVSLYMIQWWSQGRELPYFKIWEKQKSW